MESERLLTVMEDKKLCRKCNQEKPVEEFHVYRRNKDGLFSYCKSCRKEYDKKSFVDNKERIYSRRKDRFESLREWIRELKSNPCADCGGLYHHAAMTWDHLPEYTKLFNIADSVRQYGRKAIEEEIAKCDLVCANCHAIRTWKRNQDEDVFGSSLPPDGRNLVSSTLTILT
jgi:hypothetical protein